MILASMSETAKHYTTLAAVSTSVASWLVDHTSLFTAIAALLTGVWMLFRLIESGQRIYFNWRYGPNNLTEEGEE